jgi:hypothetical protein
MLNGLACSKDLYLKNKFLEWFVLKIKNKKG